MVHYRVLRLKEDPVTVFKLVKDGKANKSPYKYNEHIRHKTREDEPRSNYIFVGSKERSKRFQFPFPLTWQSARNYGITVHHHKRDKTNLERLKDTYRCKWIKSDGIKKLLRDISDFHSVR
jgi:hypothetical protein